MRQRETVIWKDRVWKVSIVSQGTHILYAVSTTNMSFSAKAGSSLKLEKILAFSSVLTIPIDHTVSCKSHHVAPQRKPNPASQKSHWTTTLLWTCKLFQISDSFFADFRGSVCRVEKFQNPTVRPYRSAAFSLCLLSVGIAGNALLYRARSYDIQPAYAVSTTNMSFEAGSSLKLEKNPCLFSVLTIPIVHKVSW